MTYARFTIAPLDGLVSAGARDHDPAQGQVASMPPR
jgi:hypothetical protein